MAQQKVCKSCEKPMYNMMSNVCSNTCLQKYSKFYLGQRKKILGRLKKENPDMDLELMLTIAKLETKRDYSVMIPEYREIEVKQFV